MIANARMYSISPEAGTLWRSLLSNIIAQAGVPVTVIEHPAPAPLSALWSRPDQAAVFMCGLPYSRTDPQPVLVAAPVPSPAEFGDRPDYWSDFVVREASGFRSVKDTFGKRIAFTVPDSQSGCVAALSYFMALHGAGDPTSTGHALSSSSHVGRSAEQVSPSAHPDTLLFSEIIAPTITPLGALTAIVNGAADVAPIDAYALRLLQRYRPDLTSQIRIVGRTGPTPIPPLVASSEEPRLQSAFLEADQIASIKEIMDKLLLRRFMRPDPSGYAMLRQRFAAATAYWSRNPLAAVVHPAFALGAQDPV
jgi:hypothetical protein